jgi:peptidoglycan hydrolase-like protein with peptidoglycan-binding domain
MKGAGWCAGVMLLALTAGGPVWAACQTTQTPMVEGIQRELAVNGFDPGGIDGRFGPKTSEAIRAYQRAAKLPLTGCPSQELLDNDGYIIPK